MLHEILLSLSGHSSPLLRNDQSEAVAQNVLSRSEQELLQVAARLSELHRNLIKNTAQISASHPSTICRAVSTAISSTHLGAFQRKILEVEAGILKNDSGLVGAYNIVPLTAVLGQFKGWEPRLQWLWDLATFISEKSDGAPRTGAQVINKMRGELQTGYRDIEETALDLVRVAESAWLKQVSAWVLYGRLPSTGAQDFFVQRDEETEQGYSINVALLPTFVHPATASSMLFLGASLNRVRTRNLADTSLSGVVHLSSELSKLSELSRPLHKATLWRTIEAIRLTLSRTILGKLLPLPKVLEMLQVFREFFLLGRGEFATALTHQADEKIRGRWRRADNLAHEKREGLGHVVVKDGEVSAALGRTWAALSSMQSQHADEDEELELARGLLRLSLSKSKSATPTQTSAGDSQERLLHEVSRTPFRNLLFSVPVILSINIPPPMDLFLSTSDVEMYSVINSYLLSIRRAHLRLTDLWMVTQLRRHHPAPPRPPHSTTNSGMAKIRRLRERWSARSSYMRSAWTTCSAAIFFLAETEGYLQIEVVECLWEDFYSWLTGKADSAQPPQPRGGEALTPANDDTGFRDLDGNRDNSLSLDTLATQATNNNNTKAADRDPQTLSTAHKLYLGVLARRLLLTQPTITDPLYNLLIHIDHIVALFHRLQQVWTSQDLESDEGVVDAFSDLEAEEKDIKSNLRAVEARVKKGVEEVISALRGLSMDTDFLEAMEEEVGGDALGADMIDEGDENTRYMPRRTGGIDRLLMKLDLGGWFDVGRRTELEPDEHDAF